MGGRTRRAGQLIERGVRTWLVRVYLGRDVNGKRRYLNRTVRGNKRDAQALLNDLLRKKDLGQLVQPARQSLNEFLDTWLETAAKPRLSTRTFHDYASLLRLYVRPELGMRLLDQITPVEIQRLWNQLGERGYSPATIRKTHTVLKNALNQAIRWRLVANNPAEYVELPRQQQREARALSPEQAAVFLQAAKGTRHGVFFTLLLTTGLRPGEALALRWSDLDFSAGTLTVQRAVVGRENDRRIEQPKTPKSRRTLPIPKTVLRMIREHAENQEQERSKAGCEWQALDLIFANKKGGLLNYRNLIRRHFKPLLMDAGLPDRIRLYDLRHTCATLLLSSGVNPKVVAERLGHTSITLTLDTYSHVLPDMQKAATDKLEKMLFQRSL